MKITKDQALLYFADWHSGDKGELGAISDAVIESVRNVEPVSEDVLAGILDKHVKRRKEAERARKAEMKGFVL